MSDLVEHIEQSILGRRLLRRGQAVLVAVSGGVDSMVLLNLLNKLAMSQGWQLTVAHFNHQLRGRSSDADERFVQQAVKKLNLPMLTGRANVRRIAMKEKVSIEVGARQARHEFLAQCAKRRGIDTVVLAHHADDQIELFLLRLLRGAGSEGLAGMKWQGRSPALLNITLIRPLLDQPKSALAEYAREQQIGYREDASNANTDILRNRIRAKLIPLLMREYQPALQKVLLRQAEILGAESDFLSDAAYRWLGKRQRIKFERLPVALQRRCLQIQFQQSGLTPNFELVEKVRTSAGRAVMTEGGVSVSRDVSGKLGLKHEKPSTFKSGKLAVTLKAGKGVAEFGGARIRWQTEKIPGGTFRAPTKVENCELFDAHKAGKRMMLRHWQAGDRFQPLGMPRPVKLQDLFTNQKIPRHRRRELIVATTQTGEIFWVEHLPPGERFKLDKSSRLRLNWRWEQL